MLKRRAAEFYYDKLADKNYDFENIIRIIRIYFEIKENRQFYLSEWKIVTFLKIISDNPDKNRLKYLQILFDIL
jgi:hypothetical protein